MATDRRLGFNHPFVWVTAVFLVLGGATYGLVPTLQRGLSLTAEQEVARVNAQEQLQHYLTDYGTQLDTYQAALQTGNGPALARADAFLSNERPQFAQVLGSYLRVLAKLPAEPQPLVARLQALTEDQRFRFAYTDLGKEGRLIQVSVAESDIDVRHLTLWQSQHDEILALNNYETEWQAQVNQVRQVNRRFLIANGETRQLDEAAPFIKVYERVEADFQDKTGVYLPRTMLDAFGGSEFIGETANLKLDTLLLDPERIMAACDSCGLVSQRALWQWTPEGFRQVSQSILNTEGNALYATLVMFVKRDQAPDWAANFLDPKVKKALQAFSGYNPRRYSTLERGLVVTATQPWRKKGFLYTVEGPVKFKVYIEQLKEQWQAVQVRDLTVQDPGWSEPYLRQAPAAVG
jgi:hypothetical protein